MMANAFDWYNDINAMDEPLECLLALSRGNDPFFAPHAPRRKVAEWLARLWDELDLRNKRNVHLRRVHYILVSKPGIRLPNGNPYENTEGCWATLLAAGRDARYLDLIPRQSVIDARNPEVVEALEHPSASSVNLSDGGRIYGPTANLPGHPKLKLVEPVIPQRYHIEIWTEKSTQDDILRPLARNRRLNLFSGAGEVSLTRCDELIGRALLSKRPVRILYISDFDPGGESMPIAAARKIEFAIRNRASVLDDVQVRPVALTLGQCQQFRLPRTPIKQGERRREGFEERYGQGATELDALEALHPGALSGIVREELDRYYDDTLASRVQAKIKEVQARLEQANDDAAGRHAVELKSIQEELERHVEDFNDKLLPLKWRFNEVQQAIQAELREVRVDEGWPQPIEGNEDADPLFDSRRDYGEQAQRFKRQQGKPATSQEQAAMEAALEAALTPFLKEQTPVRPSGSGFRRRF
jgi:hypothetical protein